jgi:hypothetical protein
VSEPIGSAMADNPMLSNLMAAWGGDDSYIPERDTDIFPDETQCSRFSDFIRDARSYLLAKTDAKNFVGSISKMTEDLKGCLFAHRENLGYLRMTPFQMELAEQAEQAYFQFLDSLSEMVASFTQQDLPRVERGIELCKRAAIVLERWALELRALHRQEHGVVCGDCGNFCQPGFVNCPFCEAELPSLTEIYEPEHDWVQVPAVYSAIYDGMLQVQKGQVPIGWRQMVENLRLDVDDLYQLLLEWKDWPPRVFQLQDAVEGEIDHLIESCKTSLSSLIKIQQFPEHGDPRLVDEAWYQLLDSLVIFQLIGKECRRSLWGLLRFFQNEEQR